MSLVLDWGIDQEVLQMCGTLTLLFENYPDGVLFFEILDICDYKRH